MTKEPTRWAAAALLAGAAALAGCTNDDPSLSSEFGIDPGALVSLSGDVQPILTFSCAVAGCHDAATAEEGQILESGSLFDPVTGIVGVPSSQSPLSRVEPFDSDASYVIHKLEGSHGDVGGCCERMPLGEPPLPADAIQLIRDWIDQGAQDN